MSVSIKSLLEEHNGQIRLLETHDRNSTELIRKNIGSHGESFQGLWISGLTQTTYLGIPDTELVSPLKRACFMTSNDNLQHQHRRPLGTAFDADSGGDVADIPALVAVLDIMGVSQIIIEDKAVEAPGQKVNSLKATSGSQGQADMHEFAKTIQTFKSASTNRDMMITARIESFTTRIAKKDAAEEEASVQAALRDALLRAHTYKEAGVDAIMIHSKSKSPDEVLAFLTEYRAKDATTPLVVVPTTYSETTRTALYDAGANIIIYANHLMRAKISAIGEVSNQILAEKPDLFANDPELSACLEARNYGFLLQKLVDRKLAGEEEDDAAKEYRHVAERRATENMDAVVKTLVEGEKAGCEADAQIIPVKELLKINAQQIVDVK